MAEPEHNRSHKDIDIEQLLRQQAEIERTLENRFTRKITIMFTDIEGSSFYFNKYGDIEGRKMVQRHNDILFPIIFENDGKVIKTIGDSIMASFEDASNAFMCAINMQSAFDKLNFSNDNEIPIKIRIGINTGAGIVEEKDVFGDVVNMAARIEGLARGGKIFISKSVFDEIKYENKILCFSIGKRGLKGKIEEIEIFDVAWEENESKKLKEMFLVKRRILPSNVCLESLSKVSLCKLIAKESNKEIYFFTRGKILVGRKSECDIVVRIHDEKGINQERTEKMSRKHLSIILNREGLFIHDENSTHGTFLDGKPLEKNGTIQLKKDITLNLAGEIDLKIITQKTNSESSIDGAKIIRCDALKDAAEYYIFQNKVMVNASADDVAFNLLFIDSQFWVEPAVPENGLNVNSMDIARNEIALLQQGSIINIGGIEFLIQAY